MIGQLTSLYDTQCEKCGGIVLTNLSETDDDFNDEFYLQLAKLLLEKKDVLIDADLHLKTANKLLEAIKLDGGDIDVVTTLEPYLKRNIYHFSAAKSFAQMKYYRDGMVDDKGNIKSFETFHKWVADSGEIFNSTHLRAEYDLAHNSAIMAHKWETLDSEYLEFSTVGDNKVRTSHKALDKFTAPKEHPIWRKIYPPLDWGCRCTVIPGKENIQNKFTEQEAGKMINQEIKDTIFDNNVGLSKIIFKENHPYFINSGGKEVNLSWQQYGLPNLDKIRANELPHYTPTSKYEYFQWWDKHSKKGNTDKTDDFQIIDKIGNTITLESGKGKSKNANSYFKDHILRKESERRFEFATESITILKKPDEIWFNPKDGNSTTYIKYYEQAVLKLVVNEQMKAVSIYAVDNQHEGSLSKSRKGILLYRK